MSANDTVRRNASTKPLRWLRWIERCHSSC